MTAALVRVLIIEDDPQIQKFLSVALESHGYAVHIAETGNDGLRKTIALKPDLVIVDLGLPDTNGFTVIEQLRSWFINAIFVLSAHAQESEKVKALDMGADDYITKPCNIGELLARLRVALRRRQTNDGATHARIEIGALVLDIEAHRVSRNGIDVHLTPIEFKLLTALMRHRGKILTHRQLLNDVWGPSCIEALPYVRIYVRALRTKIEPEPANPRYLLTEVGVGYRFVESLEV